MGCLNALPRNDVRSRYTPIRVFSFFLINAQMSGVHGLYVQIQWIHVTFDSIVPLAFYCDL